MISNTCLPRCGLCCSGATPAFESEIQPIIDHLKAHGRRAAKQLRAWGGNLAECPFLTPDRRCFVYEVRPAVCAAFGHIKFERAWADIAEAGGLVDLTCPLERAGRTFFTAWTVQQVAEFDEAHNPRVPGTKLIPLALLGQEIKRALDRDGKLEVPYLTSSEWSVLTEKIREAAVEKRAQV